MIDSFVTRKVSSIEFKEPYRRSKIYSLAGCDRGLYFLYNKYEELLYIGYSSYLDQRLSLHLFHKTNTKHFQSEIDHFKILSDNKIDDFRNKYTDCQDIEFYLIDKLKPKYNKTKGLHTAYC